MPGKVKVKILAGRNLPVMDRSSDTTDAYVEIKLGNTTYKTDVCRKSLNPQWNSEWYRFEMDDAELQDEPLQIRLMDHDTYSANDAIGKVYLNLNPLLLPPSPPGPDVGPLSNPISGGATMSGWFPVYDTMHGIRGEVNIIVKVELFSDFNRFRQSSCGVQFFCSTGIPHGFETHVIHGMVEELVVSDDPEYQWIDKIRTPRASNEARQTLFLKLSGEVQRKIGLKVLDLGGNAVLGYKQCFDLEGESGIVVRGLGTAVTLSKLQSYSFAPQTLPHSALPPDDMIDFSVCVTSEFGKNTNPLCTSFPVKTQSFRPNPFVWDKAKWDSMQHGRHHQRTASNTFDRPFAKRNFQRSTRSLNELGDDISLKALFEQEDMRGEVTSNTKKFFRAISAFPKSKMKNFQRSKSKPNYDGAKLFSGMRFQQKKGKSDTVTACLIKSIMESNAFLLDRVIESDENADIYDEEPELRYVDGHLELVDDSSSSSSLCSTTSETEDTSEVSSINFISRDSAKSKSDDESMLEIENISMSSKLSIPSISKIQRGSPSSKSPDCVSTETKQFDTESNSDTNTLLDHSFESDKTKIVKHNKVTYNNSLKRSETPPMSEMDPYIVKDNRSIYKETIFSTKSEIKLMVTEPSLDNDSCTDESNCKPIDITSSTEICHVAEPVNESSISVGVVQLNQNGLVIAEEGHLSNVLNILKDTKDSLKLNKNCTNTKFNENVEIKKDLSDIFNPVIVPSNLESDCENLLPSLSTKHPDNFGSLSSSIVKPVELIKTNNTNNDSLSNIDNNIVATHSIDFGPSLVCPSIKDNVNLISHDACNIDLNKPESVSNNEMINTDKRNANLNNLQAININTNNSLSNVNPAHALVKSRSDSGLLLCDPGTSSVLTPVVPSSRMIQQDDNQQITSSSTRATQITGLSQPPITTIKSSQSPAKLNPIPGIHRRSSDSDLSITPKGNSLTGSDRSSVAGGSRGGFHSSFPRSAMFKDNLDMLEYPFITMSKFPSGFILHIGGVVSARSVKLLERMTNLAEPESRDSWWTDVRMEVRSHARSLGCNVILNYTESTTICDDVCVLSVCGTAAVISLRGDTSLVNNSSFTEPTEQSSGLTSQQKHVNTLSSNANTSGGITSSLGSDIDSKHLPTTPQSASAGGNVINSNPVNNSITKTRTSTRQRHASESQEPIDSTVLLPCSICHVAYNHKSAPFHLNVFRCSLCRKKMVPDILLATIEPPEGLPVSGRGCFLQVFECRPKKDNRGELNAKEISDGLPFLEFEVHKQLLNKLHINGMNAIFGLKVQICIGEKTVAAHATGTGFLLIPLPVPPIPSVAPANTWKGDARVSQVQQLLFDSVKKNRDFYQLRPAPANTQELSEVNGRASAGGRGDVSDSDESEDDLPELDPHVDSKESFVLVVDDTQDVDQIPHLIDPHPPDGFHVVTIESLPGVDDFEIVTNLQMFTQVWRSRLPFNQPPASINKNFHRVLQGLYYKLRRMTPCAFGALRFKIDLPEQDELQISVVGIAVGLAESDRSVKKESRRRLTLSNKECPKKQDEGDMIFSLEEDQCETGSGNNKVSSGVNNITNSTFGSFQTKPHSPLRPARRSTHTPPKERYGVDLTPLSYVPGGRVERYLGNLNFFFIRESTCIRESGGLSGFVHSFLNEVLAIVRAHVTALGGNALVAYFMTDCILLNNPHKNHGQCLVNVGGDAVFVSYFHED